MKATVAAGLAGTAGLITIIVALYDAAWAWDLVTSLLLGTLLIGHLLMSLLLPAKRAA